MRNGCPCNRTPVTAGDQLPDKVLDSGLVRGPLRRALRFCSHRAGKVADDHR